MSSTDTLDEVQHHPVMEEIVDVLCTMTTNKDPKFFRVVVAYFFSKMAASQRATIRTPISIDDIPVNTYAVALATSGFGKGYSINIMENQILSGFQKRFKTDTFPVIAEQHLWKRAIDNAVMSGKTEEDEKEKLDKQFARAGSIPFTFDSGTPAAVKQVREKLLLADIGAINLQIDEIGSNLIGATDILNVFLELYDQGRTKMKLVKNTAENERADDLDGKTPANAMLFGTPTKLFDGALSEDNFYSFLETGYARRCLFAWGEKSKDVVRLTAKERFERLTKQAQSSSTKKWATHFTLLADPAKYGWEMTTPDDVTLALLTYQDECERQADEMGEHEEIRKAEMAHRHSKAIKLAGAFAFVDESLEISMENLQAAIKLVEESGESFQKVLTREKPYIKLARYLAATGNEQTHADLHEALPFYSIAGSRRQELMALATAWGYKNNVIIRKTFSDGIEFFSGETLKETNIDEMIVSSSDHQAYNYVSEPAPFDKLQMLTQAKDMHWTNHCFDQGHRCEEGVIPGFNLVAVDVDGTTSLDFVHEAMKEYTFMTYTTKRHTSDNHRFRLIMPISFQLSLDREDYEQFMDAFLMWLPFESDPASKQRSRKWLTNDQGIHHVNQAGLLNPLAFIPKTSKNEQYRKEMQELGSLDNLERWFAQRMASGDRNNQMIKFALALVDAGLNFVEVEQAVLTFNSRLANGLSDDELRNTVLVTVAKKIHSNP